MSPQSAAVSFTREDESQTVRFAIRGGANVGLGDHVLRATAAVGSEKFDVGYQVIEYPHIQRRQLEIPASVTVKAMDVRLPQGLNVGYVMGTGDEVPTALRGLGASVTLLDAEELAWSDLGRFHAIVIGVRAYDDREDLRANNKRILDYAAAGGTVVVQYNRNQNWTQYAPFPAGYSATRVTDENGKIEILSGDDPLFHFPNEIAAGAWQNWAQERGTYFIVPQDTRYTDLLQVYEPFEHNQGWKKGALVSAAVGKGQWIYVGLGVWRQVTAGTDGAYLLLANLVSRGRLPGAR